MVKSLGCSNNKVTRCRNEHQPKDPSKQSFQKQRFLMKSGKNGQLTGHQLQRNTSCAFSLFFHFFLFLSSSCSVSLWKQRFILIEPMSLQRVKLQVILGNSSICPWLQSSFILARLLIYFDSNPHLFRLANSFTALHSVQMCC